MGVINLGVIKDPRERIWVQRIIELTEEEAIRWDFSRYTDYLMTMGPILAGYGGLTLRSYVERSGGATFDIYEGGWEPPLVRLCHPAARVLRSFLTGLAERDPEVVRQGREKSERMKALEARSDAGRERARKFVDKILDV